MARDSLTREGEKSRDGKKEREKGVENDSLKVTSHFTAADIQVSRKGDFISS